MSEANKAIVRRYFAEVLDGGDGSVMRELFAPGAKQHFPGRDLTFTGAFRDSSPYTHFASRIHHLIADGDYVVAHLTHEVTARDGAHWATRVGPVAVGGRTITWDAIVLFHFADGKIDEEWVSRDELDVLAQLGVVTAAETR